MDDKHRMLMAVAVIMLVFGVAVGTGSIKISIWSHEETEQSRSWAVSGPSISKVGRPCPYAVMQYTVEPYMGPYEYHWHFGDGTVEDGGSASKHIFSAPGVFHVTVHITGKDDHIDVLDLGYTTITDTDSMGVSITGTGHCHWNGTHGGGKGTSTSPFGTMNPSL